MIFCGGRKWGQFFSYCQVSIGWPCVPSFFATVIPQAVHKKQVISTEPTGRVRKAVEIFQFLECFQHMRLLAGLQSVFVLFSLLLFHKPYQVLEIPIKSGNSHLDVEFLRQLR